MLVRKQVMRNLNQLCNVCDLFDGMSERDWNLFIVCVSIVTLLFFTSFLYLNNRE